MGIPEVSREVELESVTDECSIFETFLGIVSKSVVELVRCWIRSENVVASVTRGQVGTTTTTAALLFFIPPESIILATAAVVTVIVVAVTADVVVGFDTGVDNLGCYLGAG